MKAYYNVFGWGPWQVYEHKPPLLRNCELYGKPSDFTILAAETHVKPGGLNFELVQPLEGRSLWSDISLNRRGAAYTRLR